jgi:glycosyltransferase involved in cell wall biosynthesis
MRRLLTTSYPLVVTSTHSFSRAAAHKESVHLSYTYSPMRYAWYPGIDGRGSHPAFAPARRGLRSLDRRFAESVDSFAAISTEVADRIMDCYGQKARVIFPPCDTQFFHPGPSDVEMDLPEVFMLSIGRMIGYKRHDLVIDVAVRTGIPAVIAGRGPEISRLLEMASQTGGLVRVLESPSTETVRHLYREASVTVFPPFEDFGIVPVESMACGTPVVALGRGGSRDTVGSVGGALCDSQDVDEFVAAVNNVLATPPSAEACRAQASLFSLEAFDRSFTDWVAEFRP